MHKYIHIAEKCSHAIFVTSIEIHIGKWPYLCEMRNFSFKRSGNRRSHERIQYSC